MNDKFKSLKSFFIALFVKLAFLFIIGLAFLYGIMFYFFGGIDALVKQDIQIYNFLLVSSFTLGGFSMTTAGFLSQTRNKTIRNFSKIFFSQALIFILSSVMLFSNIVFSWISKYVPSTTITVNKTLQCIFNFFLLVGGMGIISFFVGLAFMAYFFIKISSILKKS